MRTYPEEEVSASDAKVSSAIETARSINDGEIPDATEIIATHGSLIRSIIDDNVTKDADVQLVMSAIDRLNAVQGTGGLDSRRALFGGV